jgi:hypothetical protein
VLDLFSTELAKVSFPDVDTAVLRRHADEVKARHREVEQARSALDAATVELERRTEAFAAIAHRGLAYARIYAAGHPERSELSAKIGDIDAGDRVAEPEAGTTAPRRGRRRAPRPELPFTIGQEAATDSATASPSAAPGELS